MRVLSGLVLAALAPAIALRLPSAPIKPANQQPAVSRRQFAASAIAGLACFAPQLPASAKLVGIKKKKGGGAPAAAAPPAAPAGPAEATTLQEQWDMEAAAAKKTAPRAAAADAAPAPAAALPPLAGRRYVFLWYACMKPP